MAILETNILHFLKRPLANERVHAHEDILESIKADAESIPEVKSELDDYKQAVGKLSLVFKHSYKSLETKYIAKLDVRRATLWRGSKLLIKICLDSPDANARAAAEDLSILVNNTYGNVPHFSLYGETGSLEHAIANFRSSENQAKVALVNGLPGLIDELEAVNNELETLYHKRLQEVAAVKRLGKLTTNLKQTDKLLIALFHALNTVYDYNARAAQLPATKAAIERIATQVRAILAQLKKVIKHHKPGRHQKPDIPNPEVPGEGEGEGEGGSQARDISNYPSVL